MYVGSAWIDLFNGLFIMMGITTVKSNINSGPYLFTDLLDASWDHSLVMALVWSVVYGLVVAIWYYNPQTKDHRDIPMPKWQFFLVAFSTSIFHWILDLPVHNNDLALYPGSDVFFGWAWWGRFGAWSWVFELALSWTFIFAALFVSGQRSARHYYDNSRYSTILYHGLVIGAIFPMFLNPFFSPMKWAAQNPHHATAFTQGLGVIMGYVLPIFLMNRYIEGYVVDVRDFNNKVQIQSKRRPSPAHYYKTSK